jgi:osmotically-inducible protein OsmY
MRNFSKLNRALAGLFCLLIAVSGCATVVTETAKKAWESRSTEDQVLDTKIGVGILDRLSGKDKSLLLDIGVDVWEQRVMLTGVLDKAATIDEVARLVKEDSRIKKIHNEIQLVTAAEKEKRRKDKDESDKKESGAGQSVNDFWLETKISARLLTTKKVTSVNYRWRSVLNKVFVIGRAADGMERDLVLSVIKETEGVKSIKDFIKH